jgi:hypothetical protein
MASVNLRAVAHKILPKSVKPRRIYFGLAKGAIANIDFNLDAAFYFGYHEPFLKRYYVQILRRGMRCFDVGMYRGWDALAFAFITAAPVVSFDGNERCLEMTRELLRPSGVDVTLTRAYLSDGDGDMTIDEAAQAYFAPNFIKIDVEGAEAAVLRGAHKTLSENRPALIVETHGAAVEAECVSILRSHGYTPEIIERHGLLSEARSLMHNRWLVCASNA